MNPWLAWYEFWATYTVALLYGTGEKRHHIGKLHLVVTERKEASK